MYIIIICMSVQIVYTPCNFYNNYIIIMLKIFIYIMEIHAGSYIIIINNFIVEYCFRFEAFQLLL